MRYILKIVLFNVMNTGNAGIISVLFLVIVIIMSWGGYYVERNRNAKIAERLHKTINDQSICLEIVNEERDWLLKEIHHRVKNSLQIVMSLLNIQLSYLRNEEASKAIRNSQHRMYAISLVHQMLYQTDSISSIDTVVYTRELLEYLKDAYPVGNDIDFVLELEPLSLDVDKALPFGLIVNEAVSNALKYAFPGASNGVLKINLKSSEGSDYTLQIIDNGIGFNENDGLYTDDSFGKNLMAGLANQLGGTYQMINKQGVEIIVRFNNTGKKIFKNHYQPL